MIIRYLSEEVSKVVHGIVMMSFAHESDVLQNSDH